MGLNQNLIDNNVDTSTGWTSEKLKTLIEQMEELVPLFLPLIEWCIFWSGKLVLQPIYIARSWVWSKNLKDSTLQAVRGTQVQRSRRRRERDHDQVQLPWTSTATVDQHAGTASLRFTPTQTLSLITSKRQIHQHSKIRRQAGLSKRRFGQVRRAEESTRVGTGSLQPACCQVFLGFCISHPVPTFPSATSFSTQRTAQSPESVDEQTFNWHLTFIWHLTDI